MRGFGHEHAAGRGWIPQQHPAWGHDSRRSTSPRSSSSAPKAARLASPANALVTGRRGRICTRGRGPSACSGSRRALLGFFVGIMSRLVKIQDIDQFYEVINVPEGVITPAVLASVRQLDERCDLEPMLREVLWDPTETPHGPTEIADIFTTKIRVKGKRCLGAFVVKGKSFAKVRSQHIDHQVLRLRQIPGLDVMVLVAVGHIQDSAQRDFVQVALDAGCSYLIVDAIDCARLLVAYEKICPEDGTPYGLEGRCRCGHSQDEGTKLTMRAREGMRYEIPELRDVSHRGAKRLTARVLVDPHYDREVLREIIREATRQVRRSSYCRSDLVRNRWRDSQAHVVWLYLAADLQDLAGANWLAQAQWIDPKLDPRMRPMELSASEHVDSIAVAWNESYKTMQRFYREHAVDKDSDRYKVINFIGVAACNSIPHETHRGPARVRPSVPWAP